MSRFFFALKMFLFHLEAVTLPPLCLSIFRLGAVSLPAGGCHSSSSDTSKFLLEAISLPPRTVTFSPLICLHKEITTSIVYIPP